MSIDSLPREILTYVASLVEDPSSFALVKKSFNQASSASFSYFFHDYCGEPYLKDQVAAAYRQLKFSDSHSLTLVRQQQLVRNVYLNVLKKTSKLKGGSAISKLMQLNMHSRIGSRCLADLEMWNNEKLMANALMSLFEKISKQVPDAQMIFNQLRRIPDDTLRKKQILEFLSDPANQKSLNHILEINLTNCNLHFLPPEIHFLKNLQFLHLGNNSLKTLPQEVALLDRLRDLSIDRNQMHEIPPCIVNLRALRTLCIRNNFLSCLPKEIGQLSQLDHLFLQHNRIHCLPPQIGELNNLTTLSIGHNKLKSLPEEVGKLSKLKSLSLSDNLIGDLPLSLGNLTTLDKLSIGHNKLKIFPKFLFSLHHLQYLNLQNNLFKKIPNEFLTGAGKCIINF